MLRKTSIASMPVSLQYLCSLRSRCVGGIRKDGLIFAQLSEAESSFILISQARKVSLSEVHGSLKVPRCEAEDLGLELEADPLHSPLQGRGPGLFSLGVFPGQHALRRRMKPGTEKREGDHTKVNEPWARAPQAATVLGATRAQVWRSGCRRPPSSLRPPTQRHLWN